MASLFVIIELVVIVGLVGWLRVVRRERSELRRAYKRVLTALQAGEATTSVLRQARILPQVGELPKRGPRGYGLLLLAAFRREVVARPLVSTGAVALAALLVVSATMFSYSGQEEQRAFLPSRVSEAPRLLPPQPAVVAEPPALPLPPPEPSGDAADTAGQAEVAATGELGTTRSSVVRAAGHAEQPAVEPAPVEPARVQPSPAARAHAQAPVWRVPERDYRRPHQGHEDDFGRWPDSGDGDDDGSWRRGRDDRRRGEGDDWRDSHRGGDGWERRERTDEERSWHREGHEGDGYRAERERSYPDYHDQRAGERHGDGRSSGERFSWKRSR